MRVTRRTVTFLWIGPVGDEYCNGIFQASTPTWGYLPLPPTFLDGCKHTCWYAYRPFRRCIFPENYRAAFPSFTPPSFPFLRSTLSLREHVTLLTVQDAKGTIYRSAGKAKRLAFQAFHRYPPSVSSDCVFMRAEIPENKPRHTPGHSFPKVDDTTEIVL